MAFAYEIYIEPAPRPTPGQAGYFSQTSGFPNMGNQQAGVPTIFTQGVSGGTELVLNTPGIFVDHLAVTITSTGEAVISGTDISVHRIAALREGGMAVPEIMADFPGLTKRQVEDAIRQAKVTPYYGRPYPRRTVKHFLRKGSFGRLKRELAEIGADAERVSS